MRRILLFVLVIAGSFLGTSCLTIEERVKLNADGSGVQTLTMDMSAMLDNPMMKMGLEQELAKGGEATLRKDSTFRMIDDLAPHNPQWTDEEREIVGRMEGVMTMDIEEGIGIVKTTFPFANVGEITRFNEIMKAANRADDDESSSAGNPLGGMSDGSLMNSMFSIKGTKLMRSTPVPEDYKNPFLSEDMEEGMMDMMLEMFGDATVTYVMEFPGKVKNVKGFPGHSVIDENLVVLEFGFTEMMDDPTIMAQALSGEVKFKK